jgi:hypothetical protein
MSKVMKMLAILIMASLVVAALTTTVFAEGEISGTMSGASAYDVNQFANHGADAGTVGATQNVIGALITVIQIIGTGVAIIMLVVLAIKYISASPGDKAEIKKHAVVYVVGAVVLFAASGILGIIKSFAVNNISAAS